jgi:ribosome biogenesis protein MAK21
LIAKPEQESNLLALLVNKLGDQDGRVSSKAGYLLTNVLTHHPVMKLVVVKEVERLLFRLNVGNRARHAAISFLSQIPLSNKDADVTVAGHLIGVYFSFFDVLVRNAKDSKVLTSNDHRRSGKTKKTRSVTKTHDKQPTAEEAMRNANGDGETHGYGLEQGDEASELGSGMGQLDGVDARMMAALLTGVNRAFPYADITDDIFDKHVDSLFSVSHSGSFNMSIQSLSLIFQVQSSRQTVSDRFYRALYDTLMDRRLYNTSRPAVYLNLLHRALRDDTSLSRVKAFVKRLVQTCGMSSTPFICGSLFLIGDIARVRPGLWALVTQPEEAANGDLENFKDADADADTPCVAPVNALRISSYDGKKRDPLHCNASV